MPPDISVNSADLRDWGAIAHDYAASALSVPELCALYSVSKSVLYRRINRNGWIKRSAKRRAAAHRPPTPRRPNGEEKLARRLLKALDHKMKELETRMTQADAAPATAADSERDARTLGTLVRLFDRLKGIGAKAAGVTGAPAAGRTAGKDHHDADRVRRDLARRLEKLRDGIGG